MGMNELHAFDRRQVLQLGEQNAHLKEAAERLRQERNRAHNRLTKCHEDLLTSRNESSQLSQENDRLVQMAREKDQLLAQEKSRLHDHTTLVSRLEAQIVENGGEKISLESRLSELRDQLARCDSREQELRDKVRQYKDKFTAKVNEAIREQQDLYTRAKEMSKGALGEIQRQETQRKALSEQIEAGRAQISKLRETFKATLEKQAQENERKFVQVQYELDRERDKNSHLADKLAKEQELTTMHVSSPSLSV